MAYHLCSSPSSLLHDRQHLCNSLSSQRIAGLRSFAYSFKPTLLPSQPKILLQVSHVSVQDPIPQDTENRKPPKDVNGRYPDGKSGPSGKGDVWVNPKSPRASRLRQKSYDARYAFLAKVAESLNTCNPNEDDVFEVLRDLGDRVLEHDAVVVLNNTVNPENALLALRYFQQRLKPKREVILYNVTLKVLRKCKDLDGAEKLFEEMRERGVKPDNVTFSTLITCARMCSLPNRAVEWFEKMPSFGCVPDDVTYSAMIDAYGRAGNIDMALSLYDRARTEKWRVDSVTFATLIKIYGVSGNFDGCLNVYQEMKALGVKPNLVIYNTLLDAMGRAKRPWHVKTFYKELINNGLLPNVGTYSTLLRAYARARYGEDALNVYKEMKEKGMELNLVLSNALLAMCADVGYVDEAVEIFEHMKSSDTCKPDSWSFSSMVTIYSCSGKVSEAEAMLVEMLEAGFQPNIFVLTSLIQCYGKAQRADDVVRTFQRLLELDISPDERFCGCLLNVMAHIPKDELGKLVDCIEEANSKLGHVVKLLVGEEDPDVEFKKEASELLDSIGPDVRKAYCNCLIDLCVNLNLLQRACGLLELGLTREIYKDIQSRSPTQWSLYLKGLSLGAALTALHVWINDLSKAVESGEELPPLLGINTGHGKHKYSDKGLAAVFVSHLKEISAPFHEAPDKVGWFLTTNVAAESWLKTRSSLESVST